MAAMRIGGSGEMDSSVGSAKRVTLMDGISILEGLLFDTERIVFGESPKEEVQQSTPSISRVDTASRRVSEMADLVKKINGALEGL